MQEIRCCPIETALSHIGKKWAINIIRDIFEGKHRFNEFLKSNKDLSTKMLSTRLKELEKDGIIEKKIMNMAPIIIEYHLTKKGKDLNKILFEMAMFSFRQFATEVFYEDIKAKQSDINFMRRIFEIK